jgi:hypothetical protein
VFSACFCLIFVFFVAWEEGFFWQKKIEIPGSGKGGGLGILCSWLFSFWFYFLFIFSVEENTDICYFRDFLYSKDLVLTDEKVEDFKGTSMRRVRAGLIFSNLVMFFIRLASDEPFVVSACVFSFRKNDERGEEKKENMPEKK